MTVQPLPAGWPSTRYEGKAGPLPMVVVRPEGPGPFPAMIDLHVRGTRRAPDPSRTLGP